MLKDQASCKKTKYHVQITCVDPGENPTDREAPRQTFIMHAAMSIMIERWGDMINAMRTAH